MQYVHRARGTLALFFSLWLCGFCVAPKAAPTPSARLTSLLPSSSPLLCKGSTTSAFRQLRLGWGSPAPTWLPASTTRARATASCTTSRPCGRRAGPPRNLSRSRSRNSRTARRRHSVRRSVRRSRRAKSSCPTAAPKPRRCVAPPNLQPRPCRRCLPTALCPRALSVRDPPRTQPRHKGPQSSPTPARALPPMRDSRRRRRGARRSQRRPTTRANGPTRCPPCTTPTKSATLTSSRASRVRCVPNNVQLQDAVAVLSAPHSRRSPPFFFLFLPSTGRQTGGAEGTRRNRMTPSTRMSYVGPWVDLADGASVDSCTRCP